MQSVSLAHTASAASWDRRGGTSASRVLGRLCALGAGALVFLMLFAAGPASAACAGTAGAVRNPTTGKLEIDLGNCQGTGQAWVAEYDGATDRSTFYPDTNANYWGAQLPSLAGQSAHWELRGAMPDARFASFQSYTLRGQTMGSVFDEDFGPAPGQVNWIDTGGRYPGAARVGYTVRADQVPSSTSLPSGDLKIDATVLSGTLAQTVAVFYRVYPNTKPNGSVPGTGLTQQQWLQRGQVPLPDLVYVIDDPSAPHFTSAQQIVILGSAGQGLTGALAAANTIGPAVAPVLQLIPNVTKAFWGPKVSWQKGVGLTANLPDMITPTVAPLAAVLWRTLLGTLPDFSAFPNSASGYYFGGVDPDYGDVLVTRFKAPTAPEPDNGDSLAPTGTSPYQVRYWSVCVYNTLTLYATGCIKDSQANLDADGYVNLVMSSGATPPIGPDGKPAANWLRNSSPNELVLIRHTLASPSFTQSIDFYNGSPTDIAGLQASAGPYYPGSVYCTYASFRAGTCNPTAPGS